LTTTPRRRVLRPAPRPVPIAPANARREAQALRRRTKLAQSRTALRRWLTRLKRATSTVLTLHQRIARLEAALAAD